MAYLPAQQLSTTYEDYPGYFLKCYLQGTTTPLSMATDSTGGTLLAKAEVSSGGTVQIGFIKTAGGAIFQPYLNSPYDAWLFPTSSEADVNDTSNAVMIADNVDLEQATAGLEKTFDTVAAMVADTSLIVGDKVRTYGYIAIGDGGDNQYDVVAAGTGTDDGGSFIDLDTLQAQGLFPGGKILIDQFGADESIANNATAMGNALIYGGSIGETVFALGKVYTFGNTVNVPNNTGLVGIGFGFASNRRTVFIYDGANSTKAITVTSAFYCRIEHFQLIGLDDAAAITTAAQTGLSIESNSNYMKNVTVQGFASGFKVDGGDTVFTLMFDNCRSQFCINAYLVVLANHVHFKGCWGSGFTDGLVVTDSTNVSWTSGVLQIQTGATQLETLASKLIKLDNVNGFYLGFSYHEMMAAVTVSNTGMWIEADKVNGMTIDSNYLNSSVRTDQPPLIQLIHADCWGVNVSNNNVFRMGVGTFLVNGVGAGVGIQYRAVVSNNAMNPLAIPNSNAFTPTLELGGASVGMTYGTQNGRLTVDGSIATCQIEIILTAKGSSTGALTIDSIPVPPGANLPSTLQLTPVLLQVNNAAAATEGVWASLPVGGGTALTVRGSGTTVALTDTFLSNTTAIRLTFQYEVESDWAL